jgi:hydrogenase nickel incorporation protein HypA/HybF
MHEMGIASSILEAVEREARLYPGHHPAKVCVRIGDFAGLDAASLEFCFDAIVKDSPAAPLELLIEPSAGDELDIAWIEIDEPSEVACVGQALPPAQASNARPELTL